MSTAAPETKDMWWVVTVFDGRYIGFDSFGSEEEALTHKEELLPFYNEMWDVEIICGSFNDLVRGEV